ncbi:MAG: FtsW/RodA/SpoVE family cell cycle protein [Chloroflexi bacterium]|nr:FtsW/RodA/SpoVE family cell cycle protein [Chloroflexota bacterium]
MPDVLQNRLLRWAAVFLFLYSAILTLSPAVREHTFATDLRWSHWLGFAVWTALAFAADAVTRRALPDRDSYLLPTALLLSGWGMLTIWRLDSGFGMRQLIWLALSVVVFLLGLRLPHDLQFLRRYKYVLLSSGLLLTALTLIFGTNPGGAGPRLWLGCCGIYLQPSEPLKLLLIIYLAAYLADRTPVRLSTFPLILPTLFVTGLSLLILLVQRDLGTASIFILLYTVILFLATDHRRVLIATTLGLALAGLVGYFFIPIVQVRVNAWLDPWADPSGRSYQIIQSLLAVANGGTLGRGPGLGSPGLVPVAISDFIFAAISEETGLVGTLGLLGLLGLVLARGMTASLRASDRFRRFLAAGLTAYLGIQSLLIIGGNLRLLPLTGVTLPFVSYGGSSLLTSFLALLFLLRIGAHPEREPAPLPSARPYTLLAGLLSLGLLAAALAASWWAVVRSPDLLTRTDNPRRAIADRYVPRGDLIDRRDEPLNITTGESGSYVRQYLYPDLGPVIGYTQPTFGQAGLEASLDDYLRGLQGNPASLVWWDHLLYGMPPPGLDVRLSLETRLQRAADQSLGKHRGAAVLMNAQSGEILVMASHPTFDPNLIEAEGGDLLKNESAPLVNRAVQGTYPLGTAGTPFLSTLKQPSAEQSSALFEGLGFFSTPQIRLAVAAASSQNGTNPLRVSPLQMAIAASALSNHGTRPAPRIALAVDTPQQGWVILPPMSEPVTAIPASAADQAAEAFLVQGNAFWEFVGQARQNDVTITWYLGGTLPNWQGTPLAVVIALEEDDPALARQAGRELLNAAMTP